MSIIIYPTSEKLQSNKGLATSNVSIGIDLGTTYSLMATVDDNHVDFSKTNHIPVQFVRFQQHGPFQYDQVIEDEKLASIVAFYKDRPYVGNNLYYLKGHSEFIYKSNIFYHWKVEMGVDHHPLYPNAVIDKLDMPFKIAGSILNFMRKNYLKGADSNLINTVITVPASFLANQRKDTLKAAEMGRIVTSSTMLIDEPNAAFLGYFNRLTETEKEDWANSVRNKNVLVVDFGGGTLDLSLLNVDFRKDTGISINNRAISRYNDLGGQDVDYLIAELFLIPKLSKIIPDFDSLDLTDVTQFIVPQLSIMAEDLKKGICNKLNLKAGENDVEDLNLSDITFSRENNVIHFKNSKYDLGILTLNGLEFKELFTNFFRGKNYKFKFIDKTIRTITQSITEIIEKANETLDAIDFVLLVGGSSLNPFLGSFISDKLVASQILISPEPDKLVAEGAAVYSYFINQHGVCLISPITSDTIGVRIKGNRFYPLIEQGKSLPRKVDIPDFKLQTNLSSEVVVPVCVNSSEFAIGEIRCDLGKFYPIDTTISIVAEITADKVFKLEVYAEGDLIGNAEFDNPYALGRLSEEEKEVYEVQSKLNKAKQEKNKTLERSLLRELIDKHYKAKNYLGILENTELYNKRFDDQDSGIWNMIYIANARLGRLGASKNALERAIEIDPVEPVFRYNYSLLLSKDNKQSALDYLTKQNDVIKQNTTVKCRIAILQYKLQQKTEGLNEVKHMYNKQPERFTEFDKLHLLKDIFDILGEPYDYVDTKIVKRKGDEGKYLDTNNIPF